MAETFTPLTTSNLGGSISSITSAIDTNFSNLRTILEDVLARGGTAPNFMTSNLDMNGNAIINLTPSNSLNYYAMPSFTAGDLLTVSSTGTVVDTINLKVSPGYAVLPAGLNILPAHTTQTGLNITQFCTGAPVNPPSFTAFAANEVNIFFENINAAIAGAGSQNAVGFYTNHVAGGAGATGNHIANMAVIQNVSSPTTAGNYVAGYWLARGTTNQGGTSQTPLGGIFGGNAQASITSGATFIRNFAGFEIDLNTGATPQYRAALYLAELNTISSNGTSLDAAIAMSAQTGSSGFNYGIFFDKGYGIHAINSTGSLLGSSTVSIANGIDLSNVTCSGAPLLAKLQTPSSSSATGTTGSICWDASYIYICTATNTWKRSALSTF